MRSFNKENFNSTIDSNLFKNNDDNILQFFNLFQNRKFSKMFDSDYENESEDDAGVNRTIRRLEHQAHIHRLAQRKYRKRKSATNKTDPSGRNKDTLIFAADSEEDDFNARMMFDNDKTGNFQQAILSAESECSENSGIFS